MYKQKNQTGFAHIFIVIVIVVVLFIVGILGVVFWQNFVDSNKAKVDNAQTNSGDAEDNHDSISNPFQLTETVTDKTFNTGMSIKYPKAWIVTNNTYSHNDEAGTLMPTSSISTVTSPDGKVSVELKLIDGGIGGTCGEPSDSFQLIQLNTDTMPYYTGARFAEYVQHYSGDELNGPWYYYFAGAQIDTENVRSVEIGDDGDGRLCRWLYSNFIETGGNSSTLHQSLNITFNNLVNSSESLTLKDINDAMATDDYKTAKQIVQSLYIKK